MVKTLEYAQAFCGHCQREVNAFRATRAGGHFINMYDWFINLLIHAFSREAPWVCGSCGRPFPYRRGGGESEVSRSVRRLGTREPVSQTAKVMTPPSTTFFALGAECW